MRAAVYLEAIATNKRVVQKQSGVKLILGGSSMKKQNVILKVGIGLVLGLCAMAFAPTAAHAAEPCDHNINCGNGCGICLSIWHLKWQGTTNDPVCVNCDSQCPGHMQKVNIEHYECIAIWYMPIDCGAGGDCIEKKAPGTGYPDCETKTPIGNPGPEC